MGKTGAAEMHPNLDASPAGQRSSGINEIHAGLLTSRVAGADVAQLLREIGEANASENSIALFRLCLSAQRMLQRMIGEVVL